MADMRATLTRRLTYAALAAFPDERYVGTIRRVDVSVNGRPWMFVHFADGWVWEPKHWEREQLMHWFGYETTRWVARSLAIVLVRCDDRPPFAVTAVVLRLEGLPVRVERRIERVA